MASDKEIRYRLNIIDEALSLLSLLFKADRRMTLTELCIATGMTKNKTFRILKTLEHQGIIDKDKQERYHFGISTFMTAQRLLSRAEMPELFRPSLEKLAEHLNEEVYLARKTMEGEAVLMIMAKSSQKVTIRSYLGSILRDSSHTKVSCPSKVINGASVSVGVLDRDITTVAVDIPGFGEVEQGALVVVAPTFRMLPERIQSDVIPVLHDTVRQMRQTKARLADRALNPGMVQGAKGCVAMEILS